MRHSLKQYVVGCVLWMVVVGCSSVNELAPLVKDSATSRDNTLVIMRVQWTEKYNDLETKEIKTQTGESLLLNRKAILQKLVEKDKTELYRVLYYLNNFRFEFEQKGGERSVFTRFGKNLLQYEPLALYQLKPGKFSLENISWAQLTLRQRKKNRKEDRWHKKVVQRQESFGEWDLPIGKVVYLGDFSMVFRTKRIMHGVLTPEELNSKIELERIEVKDDFKSAIAELKAKKPWFPAEQAVNLSEPRKWVYIEDPENRKAEEQKPKKSSENSFY